MIACLCVCAVEPQCTKINDSLSLTNFQAMQVSWCPTGITELHVLVVVCSIRTIFTSKAVILYNGTFIKYCFSFAMTLIFVFQNSMRPPAILPEAKRESDMKKTPKKQSASNYSTPSNSALTSSTSKPRYTYIL